MSHNAKSSDAAAVPSGPLEVAPNCWMVGYRNPESLLQCNTYLRIFEGAGGPRNLCIDPGSRFDFAAIASNVSERIGDLSQLHGFTVNHQDPDVVGNAPELCAANPRIEMTLTEEVWRLLQHLLIRPGRVQLTSPVEAGVTVVDRPGGLQLVPTPFCHFRGAMAFYDPEIRTLFSGDLFGGFNRVGAVHLNARSNDWSGIAQFHQIYMPSRDVLRHAVHQIRSLKPAVEVIAPQHGHVIAGDEVPLFLEYLHELLVGYDLMADQWNEAKLPEYQQIIEQLLRRAELTLGGDEALRRLTRDAERDELFRHVEIRGRDIILRRDGYAAVTKIFARLAQGEQLGFVTALRSIVLAAASDQDIPIPPVGAGLEGGAPPA